MNTPPGDTRIQLCGRLKAEVEGRHVTPALRGRQGRVLLAYLVLNRGRPVSRDELVAALWPQRPPANPSAALRTQLSRLRGALGSDSVAGRDAVELRLPDATWVDVEAAEQAIQAAEAALAVSEWKDAWAHGNVALNITSRPFLAGFEAPWVEEVRRELAELQTRARESIARAGIGLGGSELAGAERSARELVRTAPFRESGYVLLMRSLVASGNTAEALRAYERLRRVLQEELGTAPGAEIQALHRRLLTGREADEPAESDPPRPSPAAREQASAASELPLPTWLVPPRRSPFVGRTGELGRLDDLWDEAAAGRRQLVLVGGDPGMGKTRLATEFARRVHDGVGAGVLYGRADEHGSLSYQPFVEALRHWAINTPAEELLSSLGRYAGVLSQLVPEITIRLPEQPFVQDDEPARELLFDAVTSTLAEIAAARPTLLVIDDLHWADQATLLMFRHLARSPHRSPLMVLATHRDTEPSDALTEAMADLGRERLFERLRLEGLGPDETAALVASIQGDHSTPELAGAIHAETAGNPFLVEALVQHLAEHGDVLETLGEAGAPSPREAIYAGGVPSLVREAVAHRAGELGPDVERVLEVASVVGREFESELLADVSDLPADKVVAALESAVTAGLLIDVPGTLDRYAFSHSLFRQTVYSALPKARRTTLHRRLAEALERRHGSDPRHVAELARHFSSAGSTAASKALEYCVRAGAAALAAFSYEEAIEHYRHALGAIDLAASDDEGLRCEVLLALGEAEWRAGHVEDGRDTFARAGRIARAASDPDATARAALGFSGDAWERFGAPDPDAQEMLEQALEAKPDDAALRARLTARLAEVVHTAGEPERAKTLGLESVSIARASGDRGALAAALIGRWYSLKDPDGFDERLALVDELLGVCEALHDRDLSLQAQTLRARVAVETGDMDELSAAISEHGRLADQSKQPGNQLHTRAFRATRALIRGRFDEAESLVGEVIELGLLAQTPGALHYSTLELAVMRWDQGRMEEVEGPLRDLHRRTGAPVLRAALAVVAAEKGDLGGAASEVEALTADSCAAIPYDHNWLAALSFLSLACLHLGDSRRAAELFELLRPYSGRVAVLGAGAACLCPVSHALGVLAGVRGDHGEAVALLEDAAETSRRAGSEPWLARAQFRLGIELRDRGSAAERPRADQLLAESRATAERLGVGRLLKLSESARPAETAV